MHVKLCLFRDDGCDALNITLTYCVRIVHCFVMPLVTRLSQCHSVVMKVLIVMSHYSVWSFSLCAVFCTPIKMLGSFLAGLSNNPPRKSETRSKVL